MSEPAPRQSPRPDRHSLGTHELQRTPLLLRLHGRLPTAAVRGRRHHEALRRGRQDLETARAGKGPGPAATAETRAADQRSRRLGSLPRPRSDRPGRTIEHRNPHERLRPAPAARRRARRAVRRARARAEIPASGAPPIAITVLTTAGRKLLATKQVRMVEGEWSIEGYGSARWWAAREVPVRDLWCRSARRSPSSSAIRIRA